MATARTVAEEIDELSEIFDGTEIARITGVSRSSISRLRTGQRRRTRRDDSIDALFYVVDAIRRQLPDDAGADARDALRAAILHRRPELGGVSAAALLAQGDTDASFIARQLIAGLHDDGLGPELAVRMSEALAEHGRTAITPTGVAAAREPDGGDEVAALLHERPGLAVLADHLQADADAYFPGGFSGRSVEVDEDTGERTLCVRFAPVTDHATATAAAQRLIEDTADAPYWAARGLRLSLR